MRRQLLSGLVGEYEILRELGRGGQAAVFLARELSLNRLVAIKVLAPGTLTTASALERFRREATTIAALSHPNIVTIFAVRQVGDLPLFIMQYLGGKSLQRVLSEEKRLPPEIVLSILHQVGSALAFAHRRGVIHRDVKPGNVLFDEDGNAVVTDFGIAKDLSSETQTETGTVIGTPAYMSPEQCYARGGVTAASDQYSLGIMVYEMLTGGVPFNGSVYEIMRGHTDIEIARVGERVACPRALEDAVARMVRKKVDERWGSLSQILQHVNASAPPAEGELRDVLRRLSRRDSDVVVVRQKSGDERRRDSGSSGERPQSDPGSMFAIRGPDEVELGDHASFSLSALRHGLTPPESAAWSVSNEAIVSVEARSGELVARAVGTALVRAATPMGILERTVVVTEPKPASLELHVPTALMEEGESVRSSAKVLDKRGHALPHLVTWKSSNASVAVLSSDGELRAISPGVAIVSAEVAPLRMEKRIEVAAPRAVRVSTTAPQALYVGDEEQLQHQAYDRRGILLHAARAHWTSKSPHVASITPLGAAVARAPGRARFSVTVDAVVASCDLDVRERLAERILIDGVPRQLRVGKAARFAAACLDLRGRPVSRPVEWSTTTPLLVSVKQSGEVRALSPGIAHIVVAADATVAEVDLDVHPAPPKKRPLRSALARASRVAREHGRRATTVGLWVAAFLTVAVIVSNVDLSQLRRESSTLTVDTSSGIAIVVPRDSVESLPRSTTVPAAPARFDSTLRLILTGVPRESLEPHERITVKAVALRAGIRTDVPRDEVAWRSDDETVMRYDPGSWQLVAVGPGTARLSAAVDGATSSVRVVVGRSRVARIHLDPPPSIHPGERKPILTRVVDDAGKSVVDRSGEYFDFPIDWQSSDSNVLSIDWRGEAHALKAGIARVTASLDGISASIDVAVSVPDSMRVSPVILRPVVSAPAIVKAADSPVVRNTPPRTESVSATDGERRAESFIQLFASKDLRLLESAFAGTDAERRGLACLARAQRVSAEGTRLVSAPAAVADTVKLQLSSRVRWSTSFSRHDGLLELDVTYSRRGDAWQLVRFTMRRPVTFC